MKERSRICKHQTNYFIFHISYFINSFHFYIFRSSYFIFRLCCEIPDARQSFNAPEKKHSISLKIQKNLKLRRQKRIQKKKTLKNVRFGKPPRTKNLKKKHELQLPRASAEEIWQNKKDSAPASLREQKICKKTQMSVSASLRERNTLSDCMKKTRISASAESRGGWIYSVFANFLFA